jgi:Platelet-activating factor acetylhydrolase, isoform II
MEGAIVAVTRKTRTTEGMRPPAIFKHLVGLVLFGVLLGVAFTTEAVPSSNVAYRRIDVQDAATGELFPAALWYPTRAAPAPLFLTGSLSGCRFPAMLCRLIAFEMQVANNAPPADGKFGFIVISHGAGGLSLNHRDLAMALASHGYVVAAPTHPRTHEERTTTSPVSACGSGGRSKSLASSMPCWKTRSSVPTSSGSASGSWATQTVATPRWPLPARSRIPLPSLRTADSIPTIPGSALRVVLRRGKPPGRSAMSRMSVILVCAPSCSWRRIPPPSPTTRSHRWPFRSGCTARSAMT